MSASDSQTARLRHDRWEYSRLIWALVASLLVHAGSYGIYEGGKALHLWERIALPAWIRDLAHALVPPLPKQTAKRPTEQEAPLMFVNVSPNQAPVEPPKNAKYYAAQSTRAANPDAERDADTPKISGTQEHVMRTEDSQPSKAQPLQPALPQPTKAAPDETPPQSTPPPGSLTMGKTDDHPQKADETPQPKPRRIAEALARLAQKDPSRAAREKIKQDGGVRQRNVASSLDAIGSPFGVYDAAIVAAIENRWFGLLDERAYASDRSGRVVLEFRLNYDGRVTDMKVVENSVDEILCLLCQKAILDPSPYARWPSDMRRQMNEDYREIRFTFYYN
jgi:hypothetical protein